eukprot:scaffold474_cov365-Prasinococcus_capsulatus_cf.AAC.11
MPDPRTKAGLRAPAGLSREGLRARWSPEKQTPIPIRASTHPPPDDAARPLKSLARATPLLVVLAGSTWLLLIPCHPLPPSYDGYTPEHLREAGRKSTPPPGFGPVGITVRPSPPVGPAAVVELSSGVRCAGRPSLTALAHPRGPGMGEAFGGVHVASYIIRFRNRVGRGPLTFGALKVKTRAHCVHPRPGSIRPALSGRLACAGIRLGRVGRRGHQCAGLLRSCNAWPSSREEAEGCADRRPVVPITPPSGFQERRGLHAKACRLLARALWDAQEYGGWGNGGGFAGHYPLPSTT